MHVVGEMMYATSRLPAACSSDLCGERYNFVTMSNSYRILISSVILLKYSIAPMAWSDRSLRCRRAVCHKTFSPIWYSVILHCICCPRPGPSNVWPRLW